MNSSVAEVMAVAALAQAACGGPYSGQSLHFPKHTKYPRVLGVRKCCKCGTTHDTLLSLGNDTFVCRKCKYDLGE